MDEASSTDLPLMANFSEIHTWHYMIKFHLDIKIKSILGEIIIFLKEKSPCSRCILDLHNLEVLEVKEVIFGDGDFFQLEKDFSLRKSQVNFHQWFNKERKKLEYTLEPWCINILANSNKNISKVIYLKYRTQCEGESLQWYFNKDKFSCVLTPGSLINNRSLFPYQDLPQSIATWQTSIFTDICYSVLCSCDAVSAVSFTDSNIENYFYTSMLVPMATFSLAIGDWTHDDIVTSKEAMNSEVNTSDIFNKIGSTQNLSYPKCLHPYYPCYGMDVKTPKLIECKLYYSSLIKEKINDELKDYIKTALEVSFDILGPYPIKKINLLIVPKYFSSYGYAAPNLLFLNESILSGDGDLYIKIAHEISHTWFGILIGPADTADSWLSEGFATFVEDIIHNHVIEKMLLSNKTRHYKRFYQDNNFLNNLEKCRIISRYSILKEEVKNQDCQNRLTENSESSDVLGKKFVKNGLNLMTLYEQVHYLKGYFLLKYLESLVPSCSFISMLKYYIHFKSHGCLVTSFDFINLFFEIFSVQLLKNGINKTSFIRNWLHSTNIPNEINFLLKNCYENELYQNSLEIYNNFKNLKNNMKPSNKKVKFNVDILNSDLHSEQIKIVLELVLNNNKLFSCTLMKMKSFLDIESRDSDIKCRWCEIIIKFNMSKEIKFLRNFFEDHWCYGIYLYAEMLITLKPKFVQLCHEIVKTNKEFLDPMNKKAILNILG